MDQIPTAARTVTESAAARSEVRLSVARIAFCLLMLARFVALGAPWNDAWGTSRALLVVPVIALPVVFSTAVLVRVRRDGRLSSTWLGSSVVLDVLVCTAALASNALFPGDAYRGILSGPDLAAMPLIVVASGLRLSPRLALLSGALGLLGTAFLVLLDATVCPVPVQNTASGALLWCVMLGGSTAVAALTGGRTGALVQEAGERATRLAEAREVLRALQGVHHDAHSAVGALALTSDRLLDALREDRREAVEACSRDLRAQLELVTSCLREVREDPHGELLVHRRIEPADVGPALEEAHHVLSRLAPGLQIDRDLRARATLHIVGGHAGLVRVLVNLLRNAAEGDGRSGARQARIEVGREGGTVRLAVVDDGPGLHEPKPGGRGIGLQIVTALVESAGGSFSIGSDAAGTRAVVRLPAAETRHARGA